MFLKAKKVYFVGIKGIGVSGLALLAKKLGKKVVGSDVADYFPTEDVLQRAKISVMRNFSERNLMRFKPDLVVTSVAYLVSKDKPKDLIFAEENNIPVLSYPQAVAEIFNQSFGIAIAGTHGKSSTAAFLVELFLNLGIKPTYIVGAILNRTQRNADLGNGFLSKISWFQKQKESDFRKLILLQKNFAKIPWFVLEADEYRNSFLYYHPRIIILPSLDFDHPDFFHDRQDYRKSFQRFCNNLQEPKLIFSYANFQQAIRPNKLIDIPFVVPGKHFQKNLNLAFSLANKLKLSKRVFLTTAKHYQGIHRRFEISQEQGFTFIDDYAHHPKEIQAFMQSVKMKFPKKKFWFIFQPHTYTRTKSLFYQFVKVLKNKNTLIVRTFASQREKFNENEPAIELAHQTGGKYFHNFDDLAYYLVSHAKAGELILTVGAGDVYRLKEAFLRIIKRCPK